MVSLPPVYTQLSFTELRNMRDSGSRGKTENGAPGA
jgi:hypothetical protein